jgi:hypothetical protein
MIVGKAARYFATHKGSAAKKVVSHVQNKVTV